MSEPKSTRWEWVVIVGFCVYFLLIANGFNQWINIPFAIALEMLVVHTVAFTLIALNLFNDGYAEYLVPIASVFFYLGFVPVLTYFAQTNDSLILMPLWTKNWFHIAIGVLILMVVYVVMVARKRK